MTITLAPHDVAERLRDAFPALTVDSTPAGVIIPRDALLTVAHYLRDEPSLAFNVLSMQTAIDYIEEDVIELVYLLLSTEHNRFATIKVRVPRDNPVVASVIAVWRSAEFQEREIYDLFGVRFVGHPDLRRLFLWEEFHGHPLRKDFLPQSQ